MKIGITFDLRPQLDSVSRFGEAALQSPAAAPSSVRPACVAVPDAAKGYAAVSSQPGWQLHDSTQGRLSTFAARLRDAQDNWEEFDSPRTIAALAEVFQAMGHEVLLLGDGPPLLDALRHGPRPDLVFNLAEGEGTGRTREARVPALLELLGIPYTGSDPLTLASTLDKDCAKRLVASHAVATPAWVLVPDGELHALRSDIDRLRPPWFAKPAYEGSSKGIFSLSVLQSWADLADAVTRLYEAYRQPVLVEEFIDGEELTVGVLDDGRPEVLGIMRVLPRVPTQRFVYSLEVKRNFEQLVDYECPARLAPAECERVAAAALAAWRALGCRDVARIDFRLRDGVPYFLEANPLPGLAPGTSDLVILAERMGLSYAELIARIISSAMRRTGLAGCSSGSGSLGASCEAESTSNDRGSQALSGPQRVGIASVPHV